MGIVIIAIVVFVASIVLMVLDIRGHWRNSIGVPFFIMATLTIIISAGNIDTPKDRNLLLAESYLELVDNVNASNAQEVGRAITTINDYNRKLSMLQKTKKNSKWVSSFISNGIFQQRQIVISNPVVSPEITNYPEYSRDE